MIEEKDEEIEEGEERQEEEEEWKLRQASKGKEDWSWEGMTRNLYMKSIDLRRLSQS